MLNLNRVSSKQLWVQMTRNDLPEREGSVIDGIQRHAGLDLYDQQRFGDDVSHWIRDASPRAVAQLARALPHLAARSCDADMVAILLRMGANPLALLAIEAAMGSAPPRGHVIERDGIAAAFVEMRSDAEPQRADVADEVSLALGSRNWWDGSTLSLPAESLPETVVTQLAGRRIEDVVEHPDLTGWRVVDVATTAIGRISIRSDRTFEPKSWIDACEIAAAESAGVERAA